MTEQATKKPRIFQIAKELNISHTEIIDFLNREGLEVTSHMSPVELDVYERIIGEFAKEKVIGILLNNAESSQRYYSKNYYGYYSYSSDGRSGKTKKSK